VAGARLGRSVIPGQMEGAEASTGFIVSDGSLSVHVRLPRPRYLR